MTAIRNYFPFVVRILIACVLSAVLTTCSDDGGDDGSVRNEAYWKNSGSTSLTVGSAEGSAAIIIEGVAGRTYSAEIATDDRWCSFRDGAMQAQGTVQETLNVLYVYYSTNPETEARSATLKFRFDGEADLVFTLEQRSSSSEGTGSEPAFGVWPELPAMVGNGNYIYAAHFAEMYGAQARNYSYCFDKTKAGAWWVAYPLASSGYTGSIPRPQPDPWSYDYLVDASYQPNLARGSYNGAYDRGHQIPNADRNGNREMQLQTFYCTNATPQQSTLNQQQWAKLEGFVRNWKCADTLYVVTGAAWIDTNRTTTDKDGKKIPIPSHYFKVLLRTTSGRMRTSGDKMSDYRADQLMSIGFWVANSSSTGAYSTWKMSVADVEKKLGGRFTFFPALGDDLAASVKNQYAPEKWGLN